MRIALLLVTLSLAVGCGRNAVRASEKEFLADQVMVFDNDPQRSEERRVGKECRL